MAQQIPGPGVGNNRQSLSEFSRERDLDKLTDTLNVLRISYPIAKDNDGKTWHTYQTHYRPTRFLIDKQGNIRYTHRGEDAYSEIEAVIQTQLVES
jgi:peroxiredoxin